MLTHVEISSWLLSSLEIDLWLGVTSDTFALNFFFLLSQVVNVLKMSCWILQISQGSCVGRPTKQIKKCRLKKKMQIQLIGNFYMNMSCQLPGYVTWIHTEDSTSYGPWAGWVLSFCNLNIINTFILYHVLCKWRLTWKWNIYVSRKDNMLFVCLLFVFLICLS